MGPTVCVALITGCAALGGALITGIVSIIVARITSKTQLKQTVIQEYFRQRKDAYSELMSAYRLYNFGDNYMDDQCAANLAVAFAKAKLVASPDTYEKINEFERNNRKGSPEEKLSAKEAAYAAMQYDLSHYSTPVISN